MNLKQIVELLGRLPSITQVALVIFAIVVVVLLVLCPSAGTSIIAFLVALEMVRK